SGRSTASMRGSLLLPLPLAGEGQGEGKRHPLRAAFSRKREKRLRLPLGIGCYAAGSTFVGAPPMRHAALAAILVSLPATAHDAQRWTFCVAATRGGAEVW